MPLVVVLSSPSGGGKTAIARALVAKCHDTGYAVSATTRAPRPGERDGTDYHFLSPAQFDQRVAAGDFAEWATYAGERYGTLHRELDRLHGEGRHAVLDLEVEGTRALRASRPDAVTIFVLPPDGGTLLDRLTERATERPEAREERLAIAAHELKAAPEYDYVVINDVLARVVQEVQEIIRSEGRRPRRLPDLHNRLAALIEMLEDRAESPGRLMERGKT